MNAEIADEDSLVAELAVVEQDLRQVDRAIQKLHTKKRNLESRRDDLKHRCQQCKSAKLASLNWEKTDHPWSEKVAITLRDTFKMSNFRPYQLSTINAVMTKHDCILLMPTGGGKSLCYQLPAMVLDGVTLVVSPLVSLMEDQVMALEALDIAAVALTASSSKEVVNSTHNAMIQNGSSLKLLYVTPEKLSKSKRFMAKLEKMYQMGRLSLLAIDEVHCCSQWGHDFRPDYKFLGIMKRQFPNVPILGLTATATSRVITDLQKILNIQDCLVLKASFNRPNLKYEVVSKSSSQKETVDELERLLKGKFNGLSGIIYCFSIKESEEIAAALRERGLKIRSYHAQLEPKVRSSVHRSWVNNSIQAVVATIAFGMGIDKPDVRFVIHNSMAKSMENFYQESGRAGRDDQLAHCVLFYRFGDVFRQSTMVFTEQTGLENLYAMVAYCLDASRCRRAIIADHFGENWDVSDCNAMCDHCERPSLYQEEQKDVTKQCRALFDILDHCVALQERVTAQKVIDVWLGKGTPKLRPPKQVLVNWSRETCERVLLLLLLEGYLREEFHFTPYSTISYIAHGTKASSVQNGSLNVLLPFPSRKPKVSNNFPALPSSSSKDVIPVKKQKLPGLSSSSSKNVIPGKKQKLELPKGKKFFVNEAKSHFSNNIPATLNSMPKSELKYNLPARKDQSTEQSDHCEEMVLSSDDEPDFGSVSKKPRILLKKQRVSLKSENDTGSTKHRDNVSTLNKANSPSHSPPVESSVKNNEITISDDDDDLDFGEISHKVSLTQRKKARTVIISDSD